MTDRSSDKLESQVFKRFLQPYLYLKTLLAAATRAGAATSQDDVLQVESPSG